MDPIKFSKDIKVDIPIENQNLFMKIQSDNTLMRTIQMKPPIFFKAEQTLETTRFFANASKFKVLKEKSGIYQRTKNKFDLNGSFWNKL